MYPHDFESHRDRRKLLCPTPDWFSRLVVSFVQMASSGPSPNTIKSGLLDLVPSTYVTAYQAWAGFT